MVMQIILQTVLVQSCYVFAIIGLLYLKLIPEQTTYFYYYSLGWDPIIILWAFKHCAIEPE